MSSPRIPSVNDTYFQHKVLTRINGQPTYESLKTLTTEIKANAASVPSTLGGGLYGHLGLVVSDEKYAQLAHTVPWINPGHPGPFAPPVGATGPQIEAAKDVWRELKFSCELYQATEKALIAQIVDSIEPIYLRALLNRTTGQYAANLRAVLVHLFATNGKITPQQVKAKELTIYNMPFDISQPVDFVFNAIDNLSKLAEHANSALTPQQMMDLAYVIFAKHSILQHDLRAWNRKPLIERTYEAMLTHFHDAQADLCALPTAGNIFHQAYAITTMADLVAQRLLDHMPAPAEDDPPVIVPPTNTANAAIQQRKLSMAARETALLAQMTEMMTLMRTSASNNNNNNNNNNNTGTTTQNVNYAPTQRHNNRGCTGRTYDHPTGGRGRGTWRYCLVPWSLCPS